MTTATPLGQKLRAVVRPSVGLFIAFSVVNASNYVFHIVVSRLLEPTEYGALNSILAILIVLSVPFSAVQAVVANRVAELRFGGGEHRITALWLGLLRVMLPVGVGLAAIIAVLTPLLTAFLHLETQLTGLLVAVYVVPSALLPVLLGALQGRMRFGALAGVSVATVIVRLGAGIGLVTAGAGVPGAVAASVASQLFAVALCFRLLRGSWSVRAIRVGSARALLREALGVTIGLAALWTLVELDLVLARHYLPPHDAADYGAAGLLARAVLFVPSAISLVALPHFSKHRGRGRQAYHQLLFASASVVALNVVATVVLSLSSAFVVRITFGDGFADAASLLPLLCVAMTGFSLAQILTYFNVAAHSSGYHLLWPAATIEVAMVFVFHGSPQQVALVAAVTAWISAASMFAAARSVALGSSKRQLPRVAWAHPESNATAPELSLIVPSYNPGRTLSETLESVLETLDAFGKSYEVLVVSDGSTDGSDELPSSSGLVSVIKYAPRQGKGVALRVGMHSARGRYIAFIDADGDLDAADLRGFLALMDLYQPDLVVGSKRHPLSRVQYPLTRRAMSWLYQGSLRVLFGLNLRDTQTGMKLIRRDVLDAVLPRMVQKRFAFDLEFLVVARRLGYRRVMEAPVTIDYRFNSTVDLDAVLHILSDTAAIFYRRYVLRLYDPGSDVGVSAGAHLPGAVAASGVESLPVAGEAGG